MFRPPGRRLHSYSKSLQKGGSLRRRLQFCNPWTKSREMFFRSRFLSFPMVIGAVVIGVVSGKAIFGPPLEEYWKQKLQEEAAAKGTDENSTSQI